MVGTRHAPAEAEDAGSQVASNPKLKAALRKLQIDANPTLWGEQQVTQEPEQEPQRQVYHFRGATYLATGEEPKAWVDQQPQRYRKQQGLSVGEKRKRGGDGHVRAREQRRSNVAEPQSNSTHANDDERDALADEAEEDIRAHERIHSSRAYDYTAVGGAEELSCIEAQRAAARARGYAVEPLPQQTLLGQRGVEQQERSRVGMETVGHVSSLAHLNDRIMLGLRQMWLIKEELKKLGEKPSAETRETRFADEQLREQRLASEDQATVGGAVDQDANGDVVTEESTAPKRSLQRKPGEEHLTDEQLIHLDQHDMRMLSVPPEAEQLLTLQKEMQQSDTPPPSSSITPQPAADIHKHISISPTPTTSAADSDDVEIITSIARHDSTFSTHDDLPAFNRGGQTLRWSMQKPDLEKLRSEGRAEEAINRGRLEGESKSAKRRRIRREMAVIDKWTVVE